MFELPPQNFGAARNAALLRDGQLELAGIRRAVPMKKIRVEVELFRFYVDLGLPFPSTPLNLVGSSFAVVLSGKGV